MLKRKQYLINKPFQLRLMAWMVGLSLAPVSVFFMGHYYFFWQLRKLGLDIQLPENHIYFRFIDSQSHKLFIFFIICSVVAFLVVLFMGLILSHQIAGPIHHLKMHMNELSEGKNLKKLSFRKNDFFIEIPDIFNKLIESERSKNKDP